MQDAEGRAIFYAPVTSGSQHDPLPLGKWAVTASRAQPDLQLQPRAILGRGAGACESQIPAGPNGPWRRVN